MSECNVAAVHSKPGAAEVMASSVEWLAGFLLPALLAVLLTAAPSAPAEERILSYHSDITVDAEAELTIAETIEVRAEGNRIQRGIYRDFPTDYRDRFGNHYRVTFDVLRVTRDGVEEPWHSERRQNGVRVYVGDASRRLAPGDYRYTITYRTNRSVGYFENHDELYWNVTGVGWDFSIDAASARVRLPGAIAAGDITVTGFTGPFGSRAREVETATRSSEATIRATTELGPREGLTLVVTWPKGRVFEPSGMDRFGYLLLDNLGLLLALTTLVAVAGFLYLAWRRYGRDPEAGITFAHYEPPEGYSPGAVRYIRRMGYDNNTLTAAIVSLAVKGYLRIDQHGDDYTLEQKRSDEPLGPGEAALVNGLFADGMTLVLEQKNHARIGAAKRLHRKALKRHYQQTYFKNNAQWLVPTVVGSVLAFLAILAADLVTPLVVVVFLLNGLLQAAALYLMKSPTRRGRSLMDKLDGFELYLSVAEKDDLEIRHPPELTPELFERYLPFAIALGVATEWAEQFAAVLSGMSAAERSSYAPHWYRGDFHPHRVHRFVSDVGSSFSSAISSAGTPPGSSSGSGGGGSSGGGGGGGGGGGW